MGIFLDKIRKPVSGPLSRQAGYALIALAAGVILGVISKMLDETAGNLLPQFWQTLDLRNFFSRMGFWLFCGICLSVYSKFPMQAAFSTFLFFAGMVASYYAYTVFIAGFYPRSYMMIWIGMTVLSPFMGIVCWYARGTHGISICISAIIFMVMTRQAFAFGFWYLDIRHVLELLLWLLTLAVLYRTPKQIMIVAGAGIFLFFLFSPLNLFWGML